jgi:hypothetical protein
MVHVEARSNIQQPLRFLKMVVLNGDYSPRRQSIVPVNHVFLNAHLDMYLEKVPCLSLGIVLPCEIPPITLALAGPLALEAYEVPPLLLALFQARDWTE